ncbi:MAG: hypothetical protein V2A58_10080 [Planctomycetota bacterium]
MARIIQTKQASRATGGPQYYIQDLELATKTTLRRLGKCEVWLGTPYGIVMSGLVAVAADKVLVGERLRPGSVGHDRLQTKDAAYSVEAEIVRWYGLDTKSPLKRVDVRERCYHSKETGNYAILIFPEKVHFQDGRVQSLPFEYSPLTFTRNHRSNLVVRHLAKVPPPDLTWAKDQIGRVLSDHANPNVKYVGEEDILRVAGGLFKLGVRLAAYRRRGYDCFDTEFQFMSFPPYRCPVEVKKKSSNFDYQILKKTLPERAVVLCLEHPPAYVPPEVVDVLELQALHDYLEGLS